MKLKIIISIAFVLSIVNILSSQNEEDIQTLSIFSEYVKSKNYDAAYTPWMELRQRNPRFNKAIFIYGERILKNKIKTSVGQEKINFIKATSTNSTINICFFIEFLFYLFKNFKI